MKTDINGQEIALQMPKSFAVRNEIAAAGVQNLHRAVMAALGVCWQGSARPRVKYESSYSPLIYGGQVTDELCNDRGIAWVDAFSAGVVAYRLICESLPREDEVSRIEGNSEDGLSPSSAANNLQKQAP